MHPTKSRGDLHQLTELDGAAEKPRGRDDERKNRRRLTKKVGEPDQAFLLFNQRQVVAQQRRKACVEVAALNRFALVERNRLAVFTHPHHVVPKVGFVALLQKIQLYLRPTDVVRDDAARHAIQHRHPDHEAGNAVSRAAEREGKSP